MTHANARPVGDYMRVARAGLGYSRAQLAEELGLSRETIGRLERGQPTVWHVVIRHALNDMIKVHTATLEARRARRQAWLDEVRQLGLRDDGGESAFDPCGSTL